MRKSSSVINDPANIKLRSELYLNRAKLGIVKLLKSWAYVSMMSHAIRNPKNLLSNSRTAVQAEMSRTPISEPPYRVHCQNEIQDGLGLYEIRSKAYDFEKQFHNQFVGEHGRKD